MKKILISLFLIGYSCISYANNLERFLETSSSSLSLLGESHMDDESRETLADTLVIYKVNGGVNLALEMIESNHQYLLDNFSKELAGSTADLIEYLDIRWGYNTSSYMYLIEQARTLKLKLLAIDLSKNLWPAETTIFPVLPDISKVRAAREAHMAKILCVQKDIKTLVLVGSFHSKKRFLPKALRAECELESESFSLREISLL